MCKNSKNSIIRIRLGKKLNLSEIENLKIRFGVYVFNYRGTTWAIDKNTFLKNVN